MSSTQNTDGSGESQEGPENNNPKRGGWLVPAFFQMLKKLWRRLVIVRKVIVGVFKATWIILKIIDWFDSSDGG